MQTDKLSALWHTYRSRAVSTVVHPDDHMFPTNTPLDDNDKVGESAVRVIHSVLSMAPKEAIWRVLDFGCGHGRVGRHLRAMFPESQMWFADSDPSCIEFCSDTFGGTPVKSPDDFSALELPARMDLIWVGSVFTHIDLERMQLLFDQLFGALGRGGVLIATFHGRRKHEIVKATQAETYAQLLRDYETTGVGYQSYGQEDLGDWGSSMTSVETVIGLARKHPNARLVSYAETGWAGIQDVAAWVKL